MTKISSLVSRFMKSVIKCEASVESAALAAKRRDRWVGLDALEDRKMLSATLNSVVVAYAPQTFTPGQTAFASVSYTNSSLSAAGPHTVKLYVDVDGDNVYTAGTDTLAASKVITTLAGGATNNVAFSWVTTTADANADGGSNGTSTRDLIGVVDEENAPFSEDAAAGYTVTVPVVTVLGAVPGGSDLAAVEGTLNSGKFVLSRTGATSLPLTVTFAYSGTNVDASDFTTATFFTTLTATFGANQSTTSVSVSPAVDVNTTASETAGETLTLTLQADVPVNDNYTVGGPASQGVVIADTVPTVKLTVTDSLFSEANSNTSNIRVSRTGTTKHAVQVQINLNGGVAQVTTDFTASVANAVVTPVVGVITVTIPANRTFIDIKLTPIDDIARESTETMIATLVADTLSRWVPTLTPLVDSTKTINLVDNDIIDLTALITGDSQTFKAPTTTKNQTIRFTITVANVGGAKSNATTAAIGIINDSIYTGVILTDWAVITPIKTVAIPSLRAGQVYRLNFTFRLSGTSAIPASASLYRGAVKVDAGNANIEDPAAVPNPNHNPTEINNYNFSGPIISVI